MMPGHRSHALATLALAGALAGCGDFSNVDLVFAHVLPGPALLVLTPEDGDAQPLVASGLNPRKLGQEGADAHNWFLRDVSGRIADALAAEAAGESDGTRRYGPVKSSGNVDWSRLVTTSAPDTTCVLEGPEGPGLSWTLEVADDEQGPFRMLASGTSRGQAGDDACGRISYDAALARERLRSGKARGPGGQRIPDGIDSVTVDWRVQGPARSIHATLDGAESAPLAGSTAYDLRADGRGSFAFALLADAVRERGRPVDERIDVRLRWRTIGGAGRADYRISGGQAEEPLFGTWCWSEAGKQPVYYLDPTANGRPDQGDASACESGLPEAPPFP